MTAHNSNDFKRTGESHRGHWPKRNMRTAFKPAVLQALREKLLAAGQQPPDPSFKCIDFHASWSAWRVQLPSLIGKEILYFSFSDYGGSESALIQAQYHRDDSFAKAGIDLYMRVRQRYSKKARDSVLNINEGVDGRTGNHFIAGSWMVNTNGAPRQKKVSRTFGALRTRQEAWNQVEMLVKAGMKEEAERAKVAYLYQ